MPYYRKNGGCDSNYNNTQLHQTLLTINSQGDCNYLIGRFLDLLEKQLPEKFTSSLLCANSDVSIMYKDI